MSKTIKIIDLLNKIANGEEVPEKIKYGWNILKYDKSLQDYMGVSKTGSGSLLNYLFANYQISLFINNEIEIIEDEDINIQEISVLPEWGFNDDDMRDVINNLIKAVKKLDKEMINNGK